jgi:uncharacterized membrane protein YkvA (DUF1232 family)
MAKNVFFNMALSKASQLLGKPGRVVALLAKMTGKIKQVKWSEIKAADVKEKFFTLGRITKAYATGSYREVPWKTILLIAAAVIYFVNPIDLIPDWIPALGLTDDVSILLMVYNAAMNDINKFLEWERSNNMTIELL